jgi:hypothetical protein
MRISKILIVLPLLTFTCYPKSRQAYEQSAQVYVNSRAEVPVETLLYAQHLAAAMLAKAGVHLHWRHGEPEIRERAITIDIAPSAPTAVRSDALAFARLSDSHIEIFFDRVERESTGALRSVLLAHVLVHEITHILEGIDRHGSEGVMKAHWTAEDLFRMSYEPLPFDPLDVEMIRRGLTNGDRAATSAQLRNRGFAELTAAQ